MQPIHEHEVPGWLHAQSQFVADGASRMPTEAGVSLQQYSMRPVPPFGCPQTRHHCRPPPEYRGCRRNQRDRAAEPFARNDTNP
jgi:hypothetical protein